MRSSRKIKTDINLSLILIFLLIFSLPLNKISFFSPKTIFFFLVNGFFVNSAFKLCPSILSKFHLKFHSLITIEGVEHDNKSNSPVPTKNSPNIWMIFVNFIILNIFCKFRDIQFNLFGIISFYGEVIGPNWLLKHKLRKLNWKN